MKHLLLSLALLGGFAFGQDIEVLIQFGIGDTVPTPWDGSLTVTPGAVTEVTGYRFEQKDAVEGKDAWKASTRTPQGAVKPRGNNPKKLGAAKQMGPIFENGVYAKLKEVTDASTIDAPKEKEVNVTWTDPKPEKGKTSYYYFRGEQTNGELVWVSPMWIKSE